jgi:PleD family two-component response regulator
MGIIINMNDDRLNATDILKSLKALPQTQSLPILAFANHEEVGTWKLAKDLGIHKIVSRNEFSARTLALFDEITAPAAS